MKTENEQWMFPVIGDTATACIIYCLNTRLQTWESERLQQACSSINKHSNFMTNFITKIGVSSLKHKNTDHTIFEIYVAFKIWNQIILFCSQ